MTPFFLPVSVSLVTQKLGNELKERKRENNNICDRFRFTFFKTNLVFLPTFLFFVRKHIFSHLLFE